MNPVVKKHDLWMVSKLEFGKHLPADRVKGKTFKRQSLYKA